MQVTFFFFFKQVKTIVLGGLNETVYFALELGGIQPVACNAVLCGSQAPGHMFVCILVVQKNMDVRSQALFPARILEQDFDYTCERPLVADHIYHPRERR